MHGLNNISFPFFFFNDTATTEIYTLSLHDALPIRRGRVAELPERTPTVSISYEPRRSEEHTSELQSHSDLVCRLLLEKKNRRRNRTSSTTSSARQNTWVEAATPILRSWLSAAVVFFFNDTATTEIYTLSLHDALPI